MSASRVALWAAVGAVVAWAAKAVAIGVAGGLDRSPLEGPLFLVGLVLFVAGTAALGAALTAGRGTAWRVAGAVGGVAAFMLLGAVVNLLVAAVRPADPGWVWSEVNLWTGAVVLLGAVLQVRRRRAWPAVPGGTVSA